MSKTVPAAFRIRSSRLTFVPKPLLRASEGGLAEAPSDGEKENFAFSHSKRIYLEDIIRVNVLPKLSIVTRLQSAKGPFPESVSYLIPSMTEDGIDALGLPEDVNSQDGEAGAST